MPKGKSFSEALELLKEGVRVARVGWNGKGMFLLYVTASVSTPEMERMCPDTGATELSAWIGMKTADNKFVPWLASQTDLLAEDWLIVE